jgi:hypothetical protein
MDQSLSAANATKKNRPPAVYAAADSVSIAITDETRSRAEIRVRRAGQMCKTIVVVTIRFRVMLTASHASVGTTFRPAKTGGRPASLVAQWALSRTTSAAFGQTCLISRDGRQNTHWKTRRREEPAGQ